MTYRTHTVTREECATVETLQALQNAERQLAGLEHARESMSDRLATEQLACFDQLIIAARSDVAAATLAHDEALATWQAAGAPTYRPKGIPLRWNRA